MTAQQQTTGADQLRDGMRDLFAWHGLDPDGQALAGTPERWMRAMAEFMSGYDMDPEEILGRTFEVPRAQEPIMLTGIPFISVCEHHLLPFHGTAKIAYLPSVGAPVVGLSKLARLLDVYARRLQTQEQLTWQVTAALEKYLMVDGSVCVVASEHGCLAHRGVLKPGAVMRTLSCTGIYDTVPEARREILGLLGVG